MGARGVAPKAREARPRGRDEIVAALIGACERLCGATPLPLISVRDIAREADVTTGLVHHYFESKDALLVATLRSMSSEIDTVAAEALEATSDPAEMVRAVWRFSQERPAFMLIVAWWLLEGRNVSEAMGDHPFLRRLAVALGGAGDPDGQTDAAVIGSMLVAGTVFRLGFNRALGRPIDDLALPDRFESALVEVTVGVADRRG